MKKVFGSKLQSIRQAHGFTQRQLAQELDLSSTYLCDIEAGSRPPLTLSRIEVVAAFMKVDPQPLIAAAILDKGVAELDMSDMGDVHVDNCVRTRLATLLVRRWRDMDAESLLKIERACLDALKAKGAK